MYIIAVYQESFHCKLKKICVIIAAKQCRPIICLKDQPTVCYLIQVTLTLVS